MSRSGRSQRTDKERLIQAALYLRKTRAAERCCLDPRCHGGCEYEMEAHCEDTNERNA